MIKLGCQLDIFEKKELQLKNCLYRIGLCAILMISHFSRKAQPTVGGIIPSQAGLLCIRKVSWMWTWKQASK